MLLKNGADPNESFGIGTVWSFIAMARSHFTSAISTGDEKIFKLMLEHGADPKQRVRPNIYTLWWEKWPKKRHSTMFHVVLSYLKPWWESFGSILKLLVENYDHLEATDSDGVGVQDWADGIDPEIAACLRQEIALKMSSKKC